MKKIFFIYFLFIPFLSFSQRFEDYFEDKTLRIDYILGGDYKHYNIMLDDMMVSQGWFGRRINLDKLLQRGDGQIIIKDFDSNKIIYKMSFSTLFSEWIEIEDSKNFVRSFENVKLVPFPKKKSNIEFVLLNHDGEVISKNEYVFNPEDILIKKINKSSTKYRYIHKSKTKQDNAINITVLAEGYRSEDMGSFIAKVEEFSKHLLEKNPFSKYKDKFNIIAVEAESEEKGVSIPHENIWVNTIFKSNFDSFYSDRYLTTKNQKKIYDQIIGIPSDYILIFANTQEYGGGGIYNDINLTSANNPNFIDVAIHEFGHSFAGLADEYFYESDPMHINSEHKKEPWEKNITNLVDFDSKWKNKLKSNTPIPTL